MDDTQAFLAAISGNESGGDYEAINYTKDGDMVRGKYQFLQTTYDMYADDPNDWSPEAQERAAGKMAQELIDKYGYRGAAMAWIGGEGAINHPEWDDGHITVGQYADNAMATMQRILGGDIIDTAVQHVGPWGSTSPMALPKIPEVKKTSFWEEFVDKFENAFYDQGTTAAIRTAYHNIINADSAASLALNNYTPDPEDVKMVQEALQGDTVAQTFVLSNATNRKALLDLLAMKQQDKARAARVDNMDYGISTVGTILGSVLDPAMLLALIPGAGTAGAVASVASKAAKIRTLLSLGGKAINSSRAARIAVSSMSAMAYAGFDRFGAERWGGFKPDYATAITLGGVLGAIGGAIRKLPQNEARRTLEAAQAGVEENVLHIAVGATPPAEAKANMQNNLLRDMFNDFVEDSERLSQEGTDIDLHYAEREAKKAAREAEEAEVNRAPDVAQEGTDLAGVLPNKNTIDASQVAAKDTGNTNSLNADILKTPTSMPDSTKELVMDLRARATKNYNDLVEPGSIVDNLVKNGQVFILSREQAYKWAQRYGVKLDRKAKAFSIPSVGISILLKERVNKSNIAGVVLHEAAVHCALKNMLSPKAYKEIMDLVRERMRTSKDPLWLKATKNATNEEEALAYWIEMVASSGRKDGLVRKVSAHFKEALSLNKMSSDEPFWSLKKTGTDEFLHATILDALKRYAKKNEGAAKVIDLITAPNLLHSKYKSWAAAAKATGSNNPGVILKYWISHNPNKKSALYREIRKQAEEYYGTKEITDKQVQDFAMDRYYYDAFTAGDTGTVYTPKGTEVADNAAKDVNTEKIVPDSNPARERADNAQGLLDKVLQRNAEETIAKAEPVQTLPDGSHIINDTVYSPNNVVGNGIADEIEYSKEITETIFDKVSDKGVSSSERQGHFGKLGLWFEHGTFFGNIFGIMRNSHSRKMQQASQTLFYDPRMESSTIDFMPAEGIKQFLMDRWTGMYISFIDKRAQYINDTFGLFNKVHRNNLIRAVNEQIIDCYNTKARGDLVSAGKFAPEIQSMADDLSKMNEDIWVQLRKNSEQLGGKLGLGSLLNRKEPIEAKEFFRITDNSKFTDWITRNFTTPEEAEEFLTEYARRFMDTEAETKYFIEKSKYDFDLKKKKWNGKGKKPQWKEPTEEEIKAHLEQAAKNWAKGRVDQNKSRLTFAGERTDLHSAHMTNSLKHRLPVNTSGVMKMKNGIEFSFDKDLRNYDMDTYLPQILNRLSGEAALRATIGDAEAQKKLYNTIAQELAKNGMVRNGERELEAFTTGLDKFLGRRSYNMYDQKLKDAFSNMLRSLNYSNVGGNMTAAQLGEFGGAIAYGGWKTLLDCIPGIRTLAKQLRNGTDGQKIIDDVARQIYAEDIQTRAFGVTYSTDSKVFREMMDKQSEEMPTPTWGARGLDATNRAIKRAALMTSAVNFMPKLTNLMVQTMRKAAIEDSMKWASGKNFHFRNPFSKSKLAAAGIHGDDAIKALRDDIKKYLVDGRGDIDKWQKENPMSFFRWKKMMDLQAKRGIQQQSIGNMNPFKEKHRIFFQFKDFTLQAMNQQFMRALSSRNRDDALAAVYSYATNTATYLGLTYARAYAYYPNDEKKRNEYLAREADPRKVALAGFFRMSLTAPMSFASDAWEATTGQSMYRTTVDNTNNIRKDTDSWEKRVGDIMNQAPAIGYAGRAIGMVNSASNMASGHGTTKDIDTFIKGLPLGQWIGMTYMSSIIKKDSGLPEKRKQPKQKKKKQTNKNSKSTSGIDALINMKG